ncbi:hypothetical protein SAMN02910276_00815 [Butyrivibrio sp. Su6]|uniref:hypothetical protein n=1 Tax=Butyrivibrio sp. Su6 TaxID=1520810 RepID=UPI00089F2B5A|nr:hypothetical protein [Butyrivibrio sp. Su6]SEF67603.1 hypothetical protein SAMN02910276_00815 [Butyrivibrio sp. Su6]
MKENDKKNNPAYSETAYDDAFRTMEGRCNDLLIPFVNYMFDEEYDKSAVVKRLRNEHYIEHEDGSEEKRVTDSFFDITCNNITKRYHLECESKKYDGIILVRVFEYGTQIAIDNGEKSLYKARFTFPESGVLLLRAGNEVADKATIEIALPNNKEVSYDIPLIKVSDYSIDEIFSKKLYMLIPFYIFNFERKLPEINCNEAQIDDLLGIYEKIFLRLKQEQEVSNLSALSYDAIIRLTYRVAYKLTMKQDNVQKKVGDVMGGKVLDLPCFRAYDQGLEEGIEQGIDAFIEDKLEDGISTDIIKSKLCKRFEISEEKANEYINKVLSKTE